MTRLDEHVDASPHVTALALELLDLLTSMHRPAGRDLTAAAHGEKAVMLHLYRTEPTCSPGHLAEALRLTSARIANILKSLERKDLIERVRDTDDRRRVLVGLTDRGRDEIEGYKREAVAAIASVLSALGDDGPELVRIVARIRSLMDAGVIASPEPT